MTVKSNRLVDDQTAYANMSGLSDRAEVGISGPGARLREAMGTARHLYRAQYDLGW